MKKINVLKTVISVVELALINSLYYGIGGLEHGTSAWISYAFINMSCVIVFLSPIIAQKGDDSDIYLRSTYFLTMAYSFLEIVIGTAFIIIDPENYKPALFSQLILTSIFVIVLCINLIADLTTSEAVKKHKEELVYVKESSSLLSAILSQENDKQLYKKIEEVYDLINTSPVKSHESVKDLERQVMDKINLLDGAVRRNDKELISMYVEAIHTLANERNRKLKLVG